MIDIHTHITPRIDDGAFDDEEALDMLKIAADNGTHGIVLTPHYPNRVFGLERSAVEYLNFIKSSAERLSSMQDAIKIYIGAEVFCGSSFDSLLFHDELITLGGTRYILIEFSTSCHFSFMREVVEKLIYRNYVPIIAHAERYGCLQYDESRVDELKSRGAKIQVNAGTVLGRGDRGILSLGKYILQNQLADVVASDAHNTFNRSPDLSDANAEVSLRYSVRYAEKIFEEIPMQILSNQKF